MLRELPWAVTLSAAEVARFGWFPWWWKLRWIMWREFRGLEFGAVVGNGHEFDYGETPTVTLGRILELAELSTGSTVVDLGAGRGLVVMAAACLGYRARGLELVSEYVERSRLVARRMGLEVDLCEGDFLTQEWPEGDLYLLNSTAFPEAVRSRLRERLSALSPRSLVVTYDWEIQGTEFELLQTLRLPVTRGTVVCRVFSVRSEP